MKPLFKLLGPLLKLGGLAVAIPILLLVLAFAWIVVKMLRRQGRVLREGKLVRGWFVQANTGLTERGDKDLPALIVFSFDDGVANRPGFLDKIAQRIFRLKTIPPLDDTETEVAKVIADDTFVSGRRVLLPLLFTQGQPVYCADVLVERDHLPEGRLTERWSYFKALPGETETLVVSAPPPTAAD